MRMWYELNTNQKYIYLIDLVFININDTIKQGLDDQSPTELESASVLEFFDIMMRIEEGTLQTVGRFLISCYG